jgi:hypothetical protein
LFVGTLIAAALPLLMCVYLLRYLTIAADPNQDLSELLVEEIASDQPELLSPPPARSPLIEDSSSTQN